MLSIMAIKWHVFVRVRGAFGPGSVRRLVQVTLCPGAFGPGNVRRPVRVTLCPGAFGSGHFVLQPFIMYLFRIISQVAETVRIIGIAN